MPTYDLKCKDCDERFERFLKRMIRSEDLTCVSCGSNRVSVGPGGGFLAIGRAEGGISGSCGSAGFT